METKTKTADVSVRVAFAMFQGALLAMAYPLMYTIAPDTIRGFPILFLFCILPVLSFFSSSLINLFLQYMYCGSANLGAIFTGGAISPLITIIIMALSYFLPFLRKPVTQLLSELPEGAPEDQIFARDIWGWSFYLFWAGVYGQTLGSGMVSSCAK